MANEGERIRILLADRQSLFLEAVRIVLDAEDDFQVVAAVREGLEAVDEADRTVPDVALIETRWSDDGGIRATQLIKENVPGCRVIVLTSDANEDVLVQAFEAGASGYLTKDAPLTELVDAMRAVHRGETLVPARMLGSLVQRLIQHRRGQEEALRRARRLTKREREVLALLADGGDNEVIGRALVISPQTARTHIQNVITKLGLHSRLEAAMFVTHNRLLGELEVADR